LCPELIGHVLAVAHADDEAITLLSTLGAELAGVLRACSALRHAFTSSKVLTRAPVGWFLWDNAVAAGFSKMSRLT
jgi:hypothetical protein